MIPLKDIGGIIAFAGIGRNSLVLDLGTGSGGLALFLAHIAKKVVSYDINDEHIRIAEGNAKRLKIRNLKVKKKDACRGFDEKDADLVTIDIPNPWDAIKAAQNALKLGGFLVSYSPTLLQSAEFVNRIGDNPSFIHLKTVELIEREWVIKGRSVRPSSNVLFSGFLSFCRRIR